MYSNLTAIILAGGQGSRMGGLDKGLIPFNDNPLISYSINAVSPHVSEIMISANRSISQYQQLGYKVIKDEMIGGLGPLAGIYTGLLNCKTEYLISIPCDTPFLPDNLITNLINSVREKNFNGAIPYTNLNSEKKLYHPTVMLLRTKLKESLANYLNNGGRKIKIWTDAEDFCEVLFDNKKNFANLNSLDDLRNETN
ncbi:molybdenum cofactor guanylyltransferase [Betaproteobacteria bacterium]|nr:molybdenum cofactor guanylyltransferase [Betaproteobacteria bacterium]